METYERETLPGVFCVFVRSTDKRSVIQGKFGWLEQQTEQKTKNNTKIFQTKGCPGCTYYNLSWNWYVNSKSW